MMQPTGLPSPTVLSYAVPFWTTMHLLSNAVPYWSTGHSILSYAAPYWATLYPLSCAAPYWSKVHPAELHSTLTDLRYGTTLNPTELRWTLLSYAVPYWATQYPTELRSTMWATLLPNWATFSTRTFAQFVKCRNVRYRNKGTLVWYRNATVPDWDAGCRNTDTALCCKENRM